MFLQDCLEKINDSLGALGLASIETIVNEKRNINQVGYNKVVIITNNMADRVQGQSGDGMVTYPFLWDDASTGPRSLGVDGKWNCVYSTPEECCQAIKDSEFSVHIVRLICISHLDSIMFSLTSFLYPRQWQVLPPPILKEIMSSVTSSFHLEVLANPREMIAFLSNCRLMGECTRPPSSSRRIGILKIMLRAIVL